MKAICFLTKIANPSTFLFAESLCQEGYHIYICIDDITSVLPEYDKTKVTVLLIENQESEKYGFRNSVEYCKTRACSRDKGLYYFCKVNTEYEDVWFLEEDVFIPTVNTIKNIDDMYNGDLISSDHIIFKSEKDNAKYWQGWRKIMEVNYPQPWAHSMICAIRVSKKLLSHICVLAETLQYLLYDETLFNTVALQNKLEVTTPKEMENIIFDFYDMKIEEVNKNFLYHPVRDLKKHINLRETLISKNS